MFVIFDQNELQALLDWVGSLEPDADAVADRIHFAGAFPDNLAAVLVIQKMIAAECFNRHQAFHK